MCDFSTARKTKGKTLLYRYCLEYSRCVCVCYVSGYVETQRLKDIKNTTYTNTITVGEELFLFFYLNCISLRCAFQFVIVVGASFFLFGWGKFGLYECVCFCSSSELCLSTTDSD